MGDFLSNVWEYQSSMADNWGKKIQKNPERVFTGAMDEFSTKAWNGATGSDYEPVVDKFGGSTSDDKAKAESEGIDTHDGEGMHNLARTVASIYAADYAAGAGEGAAGGEAAAGGGEVAATGGGEAAASGSATSSGTASGPKPTGGESASASGWSWKDAIPKGLPQQQQERKPVQQSNVQFNGGLVPQKDLYKPAEVYSTSSKKLKQNKKPISQALIERGASGADQIDQNGVQIAAIQELSRHIESLEKRLAASKAGRKA